MTLPAAAGKLGYPRHYFIVEWNVSGYALAEEDGLLREVTCPE